VSFSVVQFATPLDEANFTREVKIIAAQQPKLHVQVVDLRAP